MKRKHEDDSSENSAREKKTLKSNYRTLLSRKNYRKLSLLKHTYIANSKNFLFAASLNGNQFNSFREQVLISINSNQPLIFGKKLQKIQSFKTTVSNFVNTVKARIKNENRFNLTFKHFGD
ncbi:hypothetical protein F4703DRAFT_1798600 [Phycomyces blakesleeanus]